MLVCTQPTQIWREKGTKQIKILVLVLLELRFCCFRKAHILKWKIVEDQKVILSTCFIVHTKYIVYFGLTAVSVLQLCPVKCIHLALFNWNSLKVPWHQKVLICNMMQYGVYSAKKLTFYMYYRYLLVKWLKLSIFGQIMLFVGL